MEVINHECYVSLEIAKLLKDAGFDWKCINRYIKDTDLLVPCLGEANWNDAEWGMNDYKSAPTLTVAQKWLREVKNVDVFAYRNEPKDKFESIVSFDKEWSTTGMCINAYEEALETGIKKALEIILEK